MSNKSFLDGLSLLIESPDIPDEIRDKLWEVYDKDFVLVHNFFFHTLKYL